jgi:hypothetical protein
MLATKSVSAVRPVAASRSLAVRPVAKAQASKATLAAAAAVVALSAAHPVRWTWISDAFEGRRRPVGWEGSPAVRGSLVPDDLACPTKGVGCTCGARWWWD